MSSQDGGPTRGLTCPVCQAENDLAVETCASCGRPLLPLQAIGPGSLIAGRYEILAPLGAGGMGLVFKARDRALDVQVAIKILRVGARELDLAARFRSEIKLAWKVRHKNVCGIHEYGEDGELLYISMELVEGHDLKQLLRERGAFVWEEAYDVSLQIAEALAAIHDAGVIHRDLKTANVMRDVHGCVRLMDFGIAKVFGDVHTGLTGTGKVIGSPDYMSPEQVRGEPADFRSDVYSLGRVIYEIFTGHPPFQADTPIAAMMKTLEAEPALTGPQAAHIPAALVPVLRKALAKRPEDRYASCREALTALAAAREALVKQATDSIVSRPTGASEDDLPTQLVAPRASQLARAGGASSQARLLMAPLLRALGHEDRTIRSGAVLALARMGDAASSAIPQLAELVTRDADASIRTQAAQALSGIAATPADANLALRALQQAGADSNEQVRDAAREAASRLESLARDQPSLPAPVVASTVPPAAPVPVAAPPPEVAHPVAAAAASGAAIATPPLARSPESVSPSAVPQPVAPRASEPAAAAANPEARPSRALRAAAQSESRTSPPDPSSGARASFGERLAQSPPVASRPGKTPKWLAAAVGIVAIVGGLSYYLLSAPAEPRPQPQQQPPAPAPTAAETAPQPAVDAGALARLRELEDKLAALEAEKAAAAAQAARETRRRLEREAAASGARVDPTALRRAEEEARQAAEAEQERRIEAERARLAAEKTAAEAPREEPASPSPTPAPDAPSIQEPAPLASATPSAAAATLPSAPPVQPGDLVTLTDTGVVAPVVLFDPAVDYPSIALRVQVQGTVQLRALVDETGRVARVELIAGPKELQQAALKRVSQRRYRPATKNGLPVKVWVPVSVQFKLG